MHKNIYFHFSMFWWKPGILILDFYLYSIKIQTNVKQNSVEKYVEKSQIFQNVFFGLGWTRPNYFDVGPANPAMWVGLELAWPWTVALHYSLAGQWRSGWRRRRRKGRGKRLTGGGSNGGGVELRTMVGLSSSSLCFFFCSVHLCFCFFLLFLMVLLLTGRIVIVGGDDDGGATMAGNVLLLFFPSVQRHKFLPFLYWWCSKGKKMVRCWGRMTMALALLVVMEDGSGS